MSWLDWAGVIAAVAVIAAYALVRAVIAAGRRWRLRELADLSRDDVDPDWERVRQTLGTDPRR